MINESKEIKMNGYYYSNGECISPFNDTISYITLSRVFFSYQLINTSFAFITNLKTDFNSHSNIDFLKCLPETLPRGFIELDTLKKLAKYFKFFPVIIGQFQNSMF